MELDADEAAAAGMRLAADCKVLLEGKGMHAQAVAIADLFGTYLSGWPPHARAEIVSAHCDVALRLAAVSDLLKTVN